MGIATGGLVVMAAAIAAGVGAGVAYLVVDRTVQASPSHSPSGSAPPSAVASEQLERLGQRIASLESELAEARRMLATRGQAPEAGGSGEDAGNVHEAGEDSIPADGTQEESSASAITRRLQRDLQGKTDEEGRRIRENVLENALRNRVKQLKMEPALTEEQVDQVAKILADRNRRFAEIIASIKPEGTADERFKEAQEKGEAMRTEIKQALEAVLQPQQVETILTGMSGPGGGPGAGGPPAGGPRRQGNRVPREGGRRTEQPPR